MPKPSLIQSNLVSPRNSLPSEFRDAHRTTQASNNYERNPRQSTSLFEQNSQRNREGQRSINRKSKGANFSKPGFKDQNVTRSAKSLDRNQAGVCYSKLEPTFRRENQPQGGARSLDRARAGDAEDTQPWSKLDLSQLGEYGSRSCRQTEVVLSMRQSNVLLSPRVYDSVCVAPSRSKEDVVLRESQSRKIKIQQVTMGPIETDSICDVFFPSSSSSSLQNREEKLSQRRQHSKTTSKINFSASEEIKSPGESKSRLPRFVHKKTSPRCRNLVSRTDHSVSGLTMSRKSAPIRDLESTAPPSDKRPKKFHGKEKTSIPTQAQNHASSGSQNPSLPKTAPVVQSRPVRSSRSTSHLKTCPQEVLASDPCMPGDNPTPKSFRTPLPVQISHSDPNLRSENSHQRREQLDDTLHRADLEHLINQRFIAGLNGSGKSFVKGLRGEEDSSSASLTVGSEDENVTEWLSASHSERPAEATQATNEETSSSSDSLHVSELDSSFVEDSLKNFPLTAERNMPPIHHSNHESNAVESAVASTQNILSNSANTPLHRSIHAFSPSARKQVHFKEPISVARTVPSLVTLEDLGLDSGQESINRGSQISELEMRADVGKRKSPAADFADCDAGLKMSSDSTVTNLTNGTLLEKRLERNYTQNTKRKLKYGEFDKDRSALSSIRSHGSLAAVPAQPVRKPSKTSMSVPGPLTTSILLKCPLAAARPPRRSSQFFPDDVDSTVRGGANNLNRGLQASSKALKGSASLDRDARHKINIKRKGQGMQEIKSSKRLEHSDYLDHDAGHKMSSNCRGHVMQQIKSSGKLQGPLSLDRDAELKMSVKCRDQGMQQIKSSIKLEDSDSLDLDDAGHKMSITSQGTLGDSGVRSQRQMLRSTTPAQEGESVEKLRDLRLQKILEKSPQKERGNIILKSRYFKLWRQNIRLLKIVQDRERLRMKKAASFYGLTSIAKHFFIWRTFILKQQIAADEMYCHHLVKKGFMALRWSADKKKFKTEVARSGRRRLKINCCFKKWKARFNKRRMAMLKHKFSHWKTRCRNKMIVDLFANRREGICTLQFFFFWREKFQASIHERMAVGHYVSVLTRKVWHTWRIFTAEKLVQKSQAEVAEIKSDGWILSRSIERWKKATIRMQYARMYSDKKIMSSRLKHWKHSTSLSRIQHQKEIILARSSRRKHLMERYFQIWVEELKMKGFRKERETQIISCCLVVWKSQMERRMVICAEVTAHCDHALLRRSFRCAREYASHCASCRAQAVQKIRAFVLRRHLKSWYDFTMRKVKLRNMQKTFYVQKVKKNMQNLFLKWKSRLQAILDVQEEHRQWILSCVRQTANKWIRMLRLKQMERLCNKEILRRKRRKCRGVFYTWNRRLQKERRADERGKEGQVLLMREKMRRILRRWNLRSQEAANIRPFIERMNWRRVARYFDAWTLLRNRRVMKEAMNQQIHLNTLLACFHVWKDKLDARNALEFAAKKREEFLKKRTLEGWKQFTLRCRNCTIVSDQHRRTLLLHGFYIWATKTTFKQIEESKKLHQHFLQQVNTHEVLLRWRSTAMQHKANEEESVSQFQVQTKFLLKKSKFDIWAKMLTKSQKAKDFASENTTSHLRGMLHAWHILTSENFQERMKQFTSSIESLRQQESAPVFSRFTQIDHDVTMGNDVITQTHFNGDVTTDVLGRSDQTADYKLRHVERNDCFEFSHGFTDGNPTAKNMFCSDLSCLPTEDQSSDLHSVAMTNNGADSGILLRDYVSTATPSVPDEGSLRSVKLNGRFSIGHDGVEENRKANDLIYTQSNEMSWSVQEEPLTVADLAESSSSQDSRQRRNVEASPSTGKPRADCKTLDKSTTFHHSSAALDYNCSLLSSTTKSTISSLESMDDNCSLLSSTTKSTDSPSRPPGGDPCSLLSSTTKSTGSPLLPPGGDPFLQPVLSDLSHLAALPIDRSFLWTHTPDEVERQSRFSEDGASSSEMKSASTNCHAKDRSANQNLPLTPESPVLLNLAHKAPENTSDIALANGVFLNDNSTNEPCLLSKDLTIFENPKILVKNDDCCLTDSAITTQNSPRLADKGTVPITGDKLASPQNAHGFVNKGTVPVLGEKSASKWRPNFQPNVKLSGFQGVVFGCEESIQRADVRSPVVLSDKEISADLGFDQTLLEGGVLDSDFVLQPALSSTINEADLNLAASHSDDDSSVVTSSIGDDAIGSVTTSSSSDDAVDDNIEFASSEVLKRKPRPILPVHVGFRDVTVPTTEWLVRLAVVRLRYRPLAFAFHQWKLLIHTKKWAQDMLSHMGKRRIELSKKQHCRLWMRQTFLTLKARIHRKRFLERLSLRLWIQWTVTRQHKKRITSLAESTHRLNLLRTAYGTWRQKLQQKTALLGILSYWQTQTKRHISPRSKERNDRELLADCLFIWRAKADQVMKAANYRNNLMLSRCFLSWTTWTSNKALASRKCEEMKTRIVKRKALKAWRRHTLLMKIVKAKENSAKRNKISSFLSRWHHHTQVRKTQQSAIMRISASSCLKTTVVCFNQWEQELTKRKVAAVMHRRTLTRKSLCAWHYVTKELRKDEAKVVHVQELVENHSTRAVFVKWLEEMLNESRVNSLRTKRLVNLAARCWDFWKENLALKRADRAHSRFLSKRYFNDWVNVYQQRKTTIEKTRTAIRKWQEITLKSRSLSRMADQFRARSRLLSTEISFNIWLIARDQSIKAKVHHQSKVVRRAFGSWLGRSRRKKILMKMQKNFKRQRRKELFAISWHKWKYRHQVRIRNSCVIALHQRSTAIRNLRCVWAIWTRRTQERNAERVWRYWSLKQVFSKWTRMHEKIRRADRLFKQNENKRTSKILLLWQSHVLEVREEQKIISELRQTRNRILVISSFMIWLKSCKNLGFASSFRDKKLKKKAFCRIKRWKDDKKRLLFCYSRAVHLVENAILKAHFSHWRLAFRRARMLEVSCDKFIEVKRNKSLKEKWKIWFKAKEKRDLQRMRERYLSAETVKTWRTYAAKRIEKRRMKKEEAVKVQHFRKKWLCKIAFSNWWKEYQVEWFLRKSQLDLLKTSWTAWTLKTAMIICAGQMHQICTVQRFWRRWRLEFAASRMTGRTIGTTRLDLLKKVLHAWRVYTYEKRTGHRYCATIQLPRQEEALTPRKKSRIPVLRK